MPTNPEWSYLIEDVEIDDLGSTLPCAAMRHEPSGVVFYMPSPIRFRLMPVSCTPAKAKLGRGWKHWKMEERALAEYNRRLNSGEILMHCEFCRVEGRSHIRGLCSDCMLICWTCGAAATVSEMPSDNYRAGCSWAPPPSTLCADCFAELERHKQALAVERATSGITDADIPF